MSDSWLVIFPTDPEWLPDPGQEALATAAIARLVPSAIAGQPELTRTANVEFIDAGENFESIRCPLCGRELDLDWWQDHMGGNTPPSMGSGSSPSSRRAAAS